MTDETEQHESATDLPTWVWCSDCGHRSGMEFHNPEKVHCSSCGQVIGEADEPVESEMAALKGYYQVVVDAETEEVLAGVEWDTDRVEIRERKGTTDV